MISSKNPSIENLTKLLNDLVEKIKKQIDETNNEESMLKTIKSHVDIDISNERKRKHEFKAKIKTFVESLDNNEMMLPLWKHKLLGQNNPPPRLILKGIRLWKCIVNAYIGMVIRPNKALINLRIATRDRERQDLSKTVTLYAESCDVWITKLVHIPLASIVQDHTLDFVPIQSTRQKAIKLKLLQLKVRVYAIIKGLISSDEVPSHIIEFLNNYTEDGNYFDDNYLFRKEKQHLIFDKLGATHHMLTRLSSHTSSSIQKNPNIHVVYIFDNETKESYSFDVTRVKMMVIHFILLRILINHVTLAPWSYLGCIPENDHIFKCVGNCRMVSSVIYEIVRSLPTCQLPPISATTTASAKSMKSHKLSNHSSSESILQQTLNSPHSPHAETLSPTRAFENANDNQKGISLIALNLSYIFGFTKEDIQRIEFERVKHKEIVKHLSVQREPFQSLSDTQYMLHSIEMLPDSYKEAINTWVRELMPKLNEWVDQMVQQILQIRSVQEVTFTTPRERMMNRSVRMQSLNDQATATIRMKNKALLHSLQDKPTANVVPQIASRIVPIEL